MVTASLTDSLAWSSHKAFFFASFKTPKNSTFLCPIHFLRGLMVFEARERSHENLWGCVLCVHSTFRFPSVFALLSSVCVQHCGCHGDTASQKRITVRQPLLLFTAWNILLDQWHHFCCSSLRFLVWCLQVAINNMWLSSPCAFSWK